MKPTIVLDTNLLIAGRWNPRSISMRILELVADGKVDAVYSPQIKDENLFILGKVKAPKEFLDKVLKFYDRSRIIRPEKRITASVDHSDNRFLEAAVEGGADYVVSSDHHLLEVGEIEGVRIVKPSHFLKIIKV
ncbi:MAG: putative toxin-antitoxin system toxin component, PIN family [Methanobacteriota archaeon]